MHSQEKNHLETDELVTQLLELGGRNFREGLKTEKEPNWNPKTKKYSIWHFLKIIKFNQQYIKKTEKKYQGTWRQINRNYPKWNVERNNIGRKIKSQWYVGQY